MGEKANTAELYQKLNERVGKVILGKEDTVRNVLCALFSGGHILLEDVPGTGKTSLVCALAAALGGACKRVQFTPDLLPLLHLGWRAESPSIPISRPSHG